MRYPRTERSLTLAAKRAWRTRYINAGLSAWHATELAGLLEKKVAERRRIQKFLITNHPRSAMHLLTLPGSQYELERTIYAERPETTFTCLERDAKFIRVGLKVMSRRAPGKALRPTEAPGIFSNGTVDLLNIAAGDLKDYTLRAPLTAIWGDFMGLLNSKDIAKFVKSLRKLITTEHAVPAVFTFQQGRDSESFYGRTGTVGGKRARKLASMFRKAGLNFKVETYWDYQSDTSGPLRMLNICGMLSHKVTKQGTGNKGKGDKGRAWTHVTAKEAITLRETTSAVPLAVMLGLDASTVRRWDADNAPDTVTQAELRKIIVACQGFKQR